PLRRGHRRADRDRADDRARDRTRKGVTAVGDTGPAFSHGPVTRTDLVRYAGASGDFNPLHHDDEYARASGLPGLMAHGMFSAGLLASFVTRWFGPGSVRRFKVRFKEPVFPGDRLSAE